LATSRLRHFVIKTALRTITLAYSRISLRDVALKLHLDSEEDTEYIVAKAIKDGVIDATIDHAGGFMQSKVARDVYETDEPQKEFNLRVDFCTQVYKESVRAMRYPPNAHRKGEWAQTESCDHGEVTDWPLIVFFQSSTRRPTRGRETGRLRSSSRRTTLRTIWMSSRQRGGPCRQQCKRVVLLCPSAR
jgi:hypothetical protein